MNGGQNNLPGSLNGDQFSLVPTNGVLSPEEYYRVQRQLDEVKQRIQVVEQNNKAALENYLAQRAQEGREAELMLAQLQAARNPQVAPASTIPASTSATASPDPGYGGNFTGIPSAAPMRPAAANGEARRSQQSSSAFASSAQPSVFHNQAVPPQPQQSHIPDVWRASVMQTATTGQMPPQSSTSQYAAVSHQASGLAQPPSQHYRPQWLQPTTQSNYAQSSHASTSGPQTQPQEVNELHKPTTYASASKSQPQAQQNGQTPSARSVPEERYHVVANLLKHLNPEMVQKVINQVVFLLSGNQQYQQSRMTDSVQQKLFERVTYGVTYALQGLNQAAIQQILLSASSYVTNMSKPRQQAQQVPTQSATQPTFTTAGPSATHPSNSSSQTQQAAYVAPQTTSNTQVGVPASSSQLPSGQSQAPQPSSASRPTISIPPQQPSVSGPFSASRQPSSASPPRSPNLPIQHAQTSGNFALRPPPPSRSGLPSGATASQPRTVGMLVEQVFHAQSGTGHGARPPHPLAHQAQTASSSTATTRPTFSSSSIAHALDTPSIVPNHAKAGLSKRDIRTPPPPPLQSAPSPAKADTSRLARDILRSLGRPAAVSPAREKSPPPSLGETPEAKRKRATESPLSPVKKMRTMEIVDHPDIVEEIMTPAVLQETRESQAADIGMKLEEIIQTNAIPMPTQSQPRPLPPAESVASGPSTSSAASPAHEVIDLAPDVTEEAAAQFVEMFNREQDQRELTYVSLNASPVRASSPPAPVQHVALSSLRSPTPDEAANERPPLFLPSSSASSRGDAPFEAREGRDSVDSDAAGDGFVLNTDLLRVVPDSSASAEAGPSKVRAKKRAVLSDEEDLPMSARKRKAESRKAVIDFVAVPPLPEWAKRMNAREKELELPSQRTSPVAESDVVLISDDEEERERKAQEAQEQQIAELSYSRLREMPCRWRGCDAVLNSANNLGQHTPGHVENDKTNYTCDWQGCATTFARKDVFMRHLRSHAFLPMLCAYEGCDRSFATAKDLLQHHSSYRHRGATVKPSTAPFVRADLEPAPPMPAVLPAYMAVPRRITRHPIPKATHAWLKSKVLENITCFYFKGRRSKAAPPTRSVQLGEKDAADEENEPVPILELWRRRAQDEYEHFAREQTRRAPPPCGAIPSAEVTHMCERGLTILPPPADDDEGEAVVQVPGADKAGATDAGDATAVGNAADASNAVAAMDIDVELDELAQDDAAMPQMPELAGELVGGGVEGEAQSGNGNSDDSSVVMAGDGAWLTQSRGHEEQSQPGWTVLPQEEDKEKVDMHL